MKPPTFARAMVRLFSDAEDRAFLLEDLADRFSDMAQTEGLRAAKRWYWLQALSIVPWGLRLRGDLIRRGRWAGVIGDTRLGLRTLRRSPLYSAGVIGTLGLGLAAAMLTFTIAWNVWLSPMPYPDPDRVIRLYEVEPYDPTTDVPEGDAESRRHPLSAELLNDLGANSWRTIEVVSAAIRDQLHWEQDGNTKRLSRVRLSPDGFPILGIAPTLGRLPAESEREVLLSEQSWRADFGADPSVVGSMIGRRTVAGVGRVPSGFPGDADVVEVIDFGRTAPAGAEPASASRSRSGAPRGERYVEAIARIRSGHSVAEATAEMNAFVAALAEIHPEHRGWRVDAVVLSDDLVRSFRNVLALLLAAGATFLLLAVANAAGLVAARRVEGQRDRSIRLALGASEMRLLRASLIESLLLAAAGSLVGGLSAYWLIGPIRALAPDDVPRLADLAITPRLIVGGLAIGVALGVIIGLSGYLISRRAKPSVGRAPAWRPAGLGGRRALVVGQVALTTLLTAGGAAILHRVATLKAIDLGFEPEGVSTTSTVIRDVPKNWTPEARWTFSRRVLDGLEARGISAATAINTPMSGEVEEWGIPQFPIRADAASKEILYDLHPVSPNYFSVMGIELLAGRDFGSEDHAFSQRVVIVSEEFVNQYFPSGTPVESVVGRVLAPLIYETTGPKVIGVVRSTRLRSPELPVEPELYSPLAQQTYDPVTLLVRGEPDEVGDAVAAVTAHVDPAQRWSPLVPYTSHLREWFAPLRLQIIMIGVLGGLGLLLVSLGLYSLMAYQVAIRRQELGIRKTVGATDGRLMREVLISGVAMAGVGALIGLGAWYQLLPWSRELVDGIDSAGYLVPLFVALFVGGACVLATLIPAFGAMRVDPVVTLKAD